MYAEVKHFEIDRKKILDEKEKIFNEKKLDKNAVYIGIDYIKEDFTQKLKEAGADLNAKTLIIWEGNWQYLEDDDVKDVFEKIKSKFKEATIVFDYVKSDLLKKYSSQFNIWKAPKTGMDNIEEFAAQYGMTVEAQKTSHQLLIKYKVDKEPSEDLHNHAVCALRMGGRSE
jgi:O-methyltransferase involved in polyketide biosynthesis